MVNANEETFELIMVDDIQYDRSVKLAEKRLRVAAYCRVATAGLRKKSIPCLIR